MTQKEIERRIMGIVDEKHGANWRDLMDGIRVSARELHIALVALQDAGWLSAQIDVTGERWIYVRNRWPEV